MDTFISRYLKSKEVWGEDPSPEWAIHQGQNEVDTHQSVDSPEQVNLVPAVAGVLTHHLNLLQVVRIHGISAYVPPTIRFVTFPDRLPSEPMCVGKCHTP